VSLGLGSVVASALDVAPWLSTIGRMKYIIFAMVAALLAFNYWLVVIRPRRMDCAPGDVCHVDSRTSRFNRAIFWTSAVIYTVSLAMTFGATLWLRWQS
jgi:cyanate permease